MLLAGNVRKGRVTHFSDLFDARGGADKMWAFYFGWLRGADKIGEGGGSGKVKKDKMKAKNFLDENSLCLL